MLGTRGMWEKRVEGGGAARASHQQGTFRQGRVGALPRRQGSVRNTNLAAKYPAKLKALIKAWFDEAKKNKVLALDDRTAVEMLGIERPTEEKARERYLDYPGTSPVPEGIAVNVRGRSYKIIADVEITEPDCSGVIFAHGSRFGGHALFIKDKKLHYAYMRHP